MLRRVFVVYRHVARMSCLQFSVFCNVVSASMSHHDIVSIMLLRVEVMHPSDSVLRFSYDLVFFSRFWFE